MYPKISIGDKEIKSFSNVVIEQHFNAHHRFSFRITNEKIDHGLRFIKEDAFNYIGKEITIKWGDSGRLKGIITGVDVFTGHRNSPSLTVVGYSSSYAFSNLPTTRSFFDKDPKNPKQTLEDIVKVVAKDVGETYSNISCKVANKVKIPYAVQYQENAFDFLNRLAARYGEWLYIDEGTIYFGNPGKSKAHELVLGHNLFSLDYELGISPVRLSMEGYNHHSADHFTDTNSAKGLSDVLDKLNKAQKNIFGSKGSEQLAWQPGSSDEVKKQGDYRYQEHIGRFFSLIGQTNKDDIKLGDTLKFKIENPSKDNAQENLTECRVISITHRLEGSSSEDYTNTFKAIDKKLEYIPVRPENIPARYHAQPEYAEVVSTEDANGRVQVSFFLNEDKELNKSCFMPCLSNYGGSDKKEPANRGFVFTHEIGDTVLVGYYKNNPNHPYVMGSLHNTKTVQLKEDNKKNEIKSITTVSGHIIEFNDKEDAESITIIDKKKNTILMNKDGIKLTDVNKNSVEMNKDGIKITDDANKNSITMASSGIEIKADKDVKISAKNIKLEAETEIAQKAGSAEVKIGTEIEQKVGSSSIKIGTAEIEQKSGAGTVKVGASGVDVKGPMIKLG